MKKSLNTILNRAVFTVACRVSLFVGSILNVINQFDAIFGSVTFSWWQAALNYSVPFLVATYSGAMQAADRPDLNCQLKK